MSAKFDMLIRIVDDDETQLEALEFLLSNIGYRTRVFNSPIAFLTQDEPWRPGCLILDLQMPQMNGLELVQELARREYQWPIIFLSAHGSLKTAVQAMKLGSKDFLEKPVDLNFLLPALEQISEEVFLRANYKITKEEALEKLSKLTKREIQIAEKLSKGFKKAIVAERFSLSLKTIDNYSQNIYRKLDIHSTKELAELFSLLH